jgi:hypothetical protein
MPRSKAAKKRRKKELHRRHLEAVYTAERRRERDQQLIRERAELKIGNRISCRHKYPFETIEEAEAEAERLKRTKHILCNAYECDACRYFHVGKLPFVKRAERAVRAKKGATLRE